MDLVILIVVFAVQVRVQQIAQETVVAMENVRRENVSAIRDSWVQIAVSVHRELTVVKVSESMHFYLDVIALETHIKVMESCFLH